MEVLLIFTKKGATQERLDRVGFNSTLNDVTERARRNLLLFSSLCIFLFLTGELPSQIPLLGIDLEGSKNAAITAKSIACVQFYFLVRFFILVSVEVKNWLYNHVVSLSDGELGENTYELKSDTKREIVQRFRVATAISKLAYFLRLIEALFPALYGILGLVYALRLAMNFS